MRPATLRWLIPHRQARLLRKVRRAAEDHAASGPRLTAAVLTARRAGVPAVMIARAALRANSPVALATAELALFGQCSYPPPGRPASAPSDREEP